jgi:hypothetical protein
MQYSQGAGRFLRDLRARGAMKAKLGKNLRRKTTIFLSRFA